jgi:DNA mismatch endonuclease, patch repair protein
VPIVGGQCKSGVPISGIIDSFGRSCVTRSAAFDFPQMKVSRPIFSDVPEPRRRVMAAIRGRDTGPEIAVRRMLHAMGYRYRVHRRDLPGHPDVTFPSRRKIVFVHGCFWHQHSGCKAAKVPRTRTQYWGPKLAKNMERDRRNLEALTNSGWAVTIVWECELAHPGDVAARLANFLGPPGIRSLRAA